MYEKMLKFIYSSLKRLDNAKTKPVSLNESILFMIILSLFHIKKVSLLKKNLNFNLIIKW